MLLQWAKLCSADWPRAIESELMAAGAGAPCVLTELADGSPAAAALRETPPAGIERTAGLRRAGQMADEPGCHQGEGQALAVRSCQLTQHSSGSLCLVDLSGFSTNTLPAACWAVGPCPGSHAHALLAA